MKEAVRPENEVQRLRILDRLKILDTDIEEAFDASTRTAAHVCQTPIALISLVDRDLQWFKSHFGLEARETPRKFAFFTHAILDNQVFEIKDSRKDDRFHDNSLVTGAPNVIFYAGQPLMIGDVYNVGTLCVIDHKSTELTEAEISYLRDLGRQAERLLEMRIVNNELNKLVHSKSELLATMSHEVRPPPYPP